MSKTISLNGDFSTLMSWKVVTEKTANLYCSKVLSLRHFATIVAFIFQIISSASCAFQQKR